MSQSISQSVSWSVYKQESDGDGGRECVGEGMNEIVIIK